MPVLNDLSHWYGGDIGTSPTGDLAPVSAVVRSQQRVLRRLFTPPDAYLSHPDYGAGLGSFVGSLADIAAITAVITKQALLEPSVASTPAPQVTVTMLQPGILQVALQYTVAPDQIPTSLSFQVPE